MRKIRPKDSVLSTVLAPVKQGEERERERRQRARGRGEGEEKGYHVYFLVSSTWEIHQKVIDGDSCYGSTTRTTEVNANENEQQFNSSVPKH